MCNDKMWSNLRKVSAINDFPHNQLCSCAMIRLNHYLSRLPKKYTWTIQVQTKNRRNKATDPCTQPIACNMQQENIANTESNPCKSSSLGKDEATTTQIQSEDIFYSNSFAKACRSHIFKLLLKKTFSNLKDHRLSQRKHFAFDNYKQQRIIENTEIVDTNVPAPSNKDLFYHNFFLKYQKPPNKEALRLLSKFPQPVKLFIDVLKPLAEGDPSLQPSLVVTSYLNGKYWKANLTFNFVHKITTTGVHQLRTEAIRRTFLLMSHQLKALGLIYKNEDGKWSPITCNNVLLMLETLSKYGAACIGNAKGRGFKIILEQVKSKDGVNGEKNSSEVVASSEISHGNLHDSLNDSQELKNTHLSSSSDQSYLLFFNSDVCSSIQTLYKEERGIKYEDDSFILSALETLLTVSKSLSQSLESNWRTQDRPFWKYTVHVGWPFPFTVEAPALSLPASQMIGYTMTCMKLKRMKLISEDNLQICTSALECLLVNTIHNHWYQENLLSKDHDLIRKFGADVTLYCDASTQGFGAYLIRESGKVSWMCEDWMNHGISINDITTPRESARVEHTTLSTTLGELYSLVTAVCSWKHKLRGRKLICYSDNKTVVCLVNSFISCPSDYTPTSDYTSSIDHLLQILQKTCLNHNIKLQTSWISREENWLADSLSHMDIHIFQAHVSDTSPNKSKSIKIKIKDKMFIHKGET